MKAKIPFMALVSTLHSNVSKMDHQPLCTLNFFFINTADDNHLELTTFILKKDTSPAIQQSRYGKLTFKGMKTDFGVQT